MQDEVIQADSIDTFKTVSDFTNNALGNHLVAFAKLQTGEELQRISDRPGYELGYGSVSDPNCKTLRSQSRAMTCSACLRHHNFRQIVVVQQVLSVVVVQKIDDAV